MSGVSTVTVSESAPGPYTQKVRAGRHPLAADEPEDMGGKDLGPSPYDFLLAALGTCTSMTLRMYAAQKGWDLKHVAVKLTHKKEPDAENRKRDVITREIALEGSLDEAQRARLMEIADKCPVHRTLMDAQRPVVTTAAG